MTAQPPAAPRSATHDDAHFRFILLCLRSRREPGCLEAARGLAGSGQIDWERCQVLAEAEKLEPLLSAALADRQVLPAPVEERWRLAHRKNAARNALVFRALADVLRELSGVGVEAIVLKGAALALAVYGDPVLRPMTDLDLLLHRTDVPRALQALQAAGYEMPVHELGLAGALEYTNELVLHRPSGLEIPVELHWGLFDSPFYNRRELEAWLWGTSRAFPGGSLLPHTVTSCAAPWAEADPGRNASPLQARILGPEAQILHLCGHQALHHGGQGLLWLNDIAEIVAHHGDRIDWQTVVRQAEAFDLVLPSREALPRVAENWGAPIPTGTLARLQVSPLSPDEARAFRWMTEPDGGVALEVWANLSGMSGLAGRAHYLAKKLFPSQAYMRQRYGYSHAALLPLYYPYRWWLGLRSALARVNRAMRSLDGQPGV